MAHFSETLCEEVIRTEGRCGLSQNEITQMARFALRAIRSESPFRRDAFRYRWLKSSGPEARLFIALWQGGPITALADEFADHAVDAAMSGNR